MKLTPANSRSGLLSFRLATALVACGLIPLLAFAAAPGWWSQRGVLISTAAPDDYALANQGQLKNIAKAAVDEFDARLPGGAGNTLHNLVSGWNQSNVQTNDFAPVNLGQIKNVAKPFYDRLITVHYADNYPWTSSPNPPDDFAIANIGQVKRLFSFDLLATDLVHDSDQNSLPDWWEKFYFGHIGVDPNALASRGDGLTNLQAFQQGLSPIDYYNGRAPGLIVVGGNNQESAPSSFLPLPFVAKVTDSAGQPLNNAPVTFTVSDGGGLLAANPGGPTAATLQLRTGSDGTVAASYQQPAVAGVTSHITAAAAAAQVVFTATTSQASQGLTVTPDNLNEIVNAGQTVTRNVTVTNNSNATRQVTAALERSYNATVSYTDSDQPGGPEFIWNDISSTGTRLNSVSDSDEAAEEVDLSFGFPYFGDSYQKIYVTTNGFITVGQENQQYENHPLPGADMPANEIAAFHTDLNTDDTSGGSGDVYYQDFGDRIVIQYSNVARYGGDGLATFQIVLQLDGTILFYYKEMTGTIADATVGVQDFTRNYGRTISYQQSYLRNNLAVRIATLAERFTTSVENIAWSDSDQPGGPAFVWEDITATGTHMDRLSNLDDGSDPLDISFPFPYFGETYSTIFVSANGFVTLYAPTAESRTFSFPDPSAPPTDIAAFQNDLNLRASGDVYYKDDGDRVVIQFNNAARYAGDGFATFQMVLQRDGAILFYYKEMIGKVDAASVGIQNLDGDKGVTIANEQPYLKNNLAVRITDSTDWLRVSPTSATLAPSESASLAVTLDAHDLRNGVFHGRINLASDDPAAPAVLVPVTMTINEGPKITLSLLEHAPIYVAGEQVTVIATVNDPYGVDMVEFFDGDIKVGEATTPEFSFAWPNPSPGPHPITARAVDHRGAAGASQPLGIDVQLDSNHNGMGDQWEMEQFGNLSQTAEGDFDHDGWSNLAEFRAGTNPTHFDDADGDGVGDGDEINVYHTNPKLADTDGDRMPDGWEVKYHLNPLRDDSQIDSDFDGLSNAEELLLGTRPDLKDTDGDGKWDDKDGWPNDFDLHPPRLPECTYALIDLGPGKAVGVNNNNQVIVEISRVEGTGFVWDKDTRIDLPLFPYQSPQAINDDGTVLLSDGTWKDGVKTTLKITTDPEGKVFGIDPNITWAYATFGGIAINNLGEIAGTYAIFGSENFPRGAGVGTALWSDSYTTPTFLQKVPDANDRILTVDDSGPHGFYKDYNQTADSWNFGGHYDNARGLDDSVQVSAINNVGQILANCENFEGIDPYGFFSRGYLPWFRSVIVWTDGQAELISQGGYSYASDINDDGIILGGNAAGKEALWVKVNGQWKERVIGDVGYRLNRNLQVIDGRYLYQNAHLVDLDTRIPSGYTITYGTDINEAGMIVGQVNTSSGDGHAVLLVPAELMVDYNRDGKIDDKDRGQVTSANPYRFWINDDNDRDEVDGDDVPGRDGTTDADFVTVTASDGTSQGLVDSMRDLVDFFPLYLDVRNLVALFPPDQNFAYTLKQDDEALNFTYTSLDPDASGDFLRKIGATDKADNAGGLAHAIVQKITRSGVPIDSGLLSDMSDFKGVILLEGRAITHKPLVLEVSDNQHTVVARVELPISIDGVERMYRHKNLMAADNASGGLPDYATGADTQHSEPENYPDRLCSNKTFVFVHGFYVGPEDARGWNAEIFKRMYWSGSKAKFVGVTWNSNEINGGTVPDYHKNVDNAFATAQSFAGLVHYLMQNLGPNVTVAAHSLGNIVVGSAIQDWGATPANYFMIDAAVPMEAYNAGTPTDDAMIHPDWNTYRSAADPDHAVPDRAFASEWYLDPAFPTGDARKTLTWRGRLGNVGTNTYNFYSSSEDVLRKHEGDPGIRDLVEAALTGGRHSWALQEKLKGRQVTVAVGHCGSTYGGWRFSENIGNPPHTSSPSESAQFDDSFLIVNTVFDPGFKLTISSPSPEYPDGQTFKTIHAGAPDWIVDLTDSVKGSLTAQAHRNQSLAEMFPARTLPSGANLITKFEDRNFDMPSLYKNGWPAGRGNNQDWKHSDFKQVAYTFICPLFQKFAAFVNQ